MFDFIFFVMANGSEKGEIVVSSIRTGMKREFAMMMKAQADWDIDVGQKRVTRTPQSSMNSPGNVSNDKVYVKKRKREVKNVIVSEDLSNSKAVVGEELKSDGVVKKDDNVVLLSDDLSNSKVVGEELERDGVVKRDENLVLLSEEEEPKSDVVDCNSDDEKKGKMDEEIVGSGEEGNASMQNCGDDAKAKADDGFNEEMAEIVPELAVTAQADGKDEQKSEDDAKSEMPKTGKASDCIVGAMPEIVPELAVVAQADGKNEQNCQDDSKTEMARTVKANVRIVEAMPGVVPELAITAQGDGKDEQNVLFQTPMRRFTRSALKTEDDAKVSQCDSIKIGEFHETDSVGTMSAPAKLELKMSKKVALTKIPTKLKDLLETGLLEGLPVRYIRGTTKVSFKEAFIEFPFDNSIWRLTK